MRRLAFIVLVLMFALGTLATIAWAESLKISMTLSNPEQLKIKFPLVEAEKHFIVFVKRQGVVSRGSTWAGAKVQEIGYHDVYPGDRVSGKGYITFTLLNGDQISMKHRFKASFLPKSGGKMAPVDHGIWTIIGATGGLAGSRGVGRFQFKRSPDDPKARVWDLTGDMAVMGK